VRAHLTHESKDKTSRHTTLTTRLPPSAFPNGRILLTRGMFYELSPSGTIRVLPFDSGLAWTVAINGWVFARGGDEAALHTFYIFGDMLPPLRLFLFFFKYY
jgi:hypothetical protein